MKKRILVFLLVLIQCLPQTVVYADEIEENIVESYEQDIPGLSNLNVDDEHRIIEELEDMSENNRRQNIRELNNLIDGFTVSRKDYYNLTEKQKAYLRQNFPKQTEYYDKTQGMTSLDTKAAEDLYTSIFGSSVIGLIADMAGKALIDNQATSSDFYTNLETWIKTAEENGTFNYPDPSPDPDPDPSTDPDPDPSPDPDPDPDQNPQEGTPSGNEANPSSGGPGGYGNQSQVTVNEASFLHLMARLAKGTDNNKAGSKGTDLGSDTQLNYNTGMFSTPDKITNYAETNGISDSAVLQGILMNCDTWQGGNSTLMKDRDNSASATTFIQAAVDKIGHEDGSEIEPNEEVYDTSKKSYSNSSVLDFAKSSYARITNFYNWLVKDEIGDDEKKLIKEFADTRKNVNWGIETFQIFDNTPIMLDDTFAKIAKVDSGNKAIALANLNSVVAEYGAYATTFREEHSGEESFSQDTKDALESLHATVETYRHVIPALQAAWEYGEPSLKDLYERKDGTDGENGGTEESDYDRVDHPQPLLNFFEINTLGQNVKGVNDPWAWFNQELTGQTPGLVLSDYIKTGIAESASYIPMMTNVYTRDVLNDMDDSDFKTNFHYKYGFMRKAVYIENSATSVQNFYTTKGKSSGQKIVCTLQKLLDFAKKNQEVTLWIDDNFYNADQVKVDMEKMANEQQSRIDNSVAYGTAAYQQNLRGSDAQYRASQVSDEATEIMAANGTTDLDANYAMDQFLLYSGLTNLDTSQEQVLLNVVNSLAVAAGTGIQTDDLMLKNADFSSYSNNLRSDLTGQDKKYLIGGDYTDADTPTFEINNQDNYVMTSYDIKQVLSGLTVREEDSLSDNTIGYRYTTYNPYTPLLSYAFVSAIYRDKSAFSLLENCSSYSPIFMASDKIDKKTLADDNVSQIMENTIFNWALLKNLESMSQISYTYTLDLEAPLYSDIYGNILTSSGTVVIPAASNATLWAADWNERQPGIGLYTCYPKVYGISRSNENEQLPAKFELQRTNDIWMPKGREVTTDLAEGMIEYSNLDAYEDSAQEVAKVNMYSYISDDSKINWWAYAGIISEVMRGAPVDSIDVSKENLVDINKNIDGLVLASKLESLQESLQNTMKQNSLFMMPDFSRMEHVEYFLAFVIKILAILTVLVVLVIIYQDGASNEIGPRTIFKTMFAVFMTFLSITLVPAIFQLSYYGANRLLLQNEADRIVMFRTEKYNMGVEVGVTETNVPTTNNDIMIRLDFIDVPWYDYITQIVLGSSIDNLDTLRMKRMSESLVAHQPDVQVYNDGVYMSVNDILESVKIDYTFGTDVFVANDSGYAATENLGDGYDKNLYMTNTRDSQTFSYYSPYYAFLRAIVTNINDFNSITGQYSYATKYMKGTQPKTVGLCENYFKSETFIQECVDIFRIHEIYDYTPDTWIAEAQNKKVQVANIDPFSDTVFTDADREVMAKSLWFSFRDMQTIEARVDAMDRWARDYIARNENVLNKISDETFIKVFCLSAALKYNQLFGISEANVYEIYNIDSNDLLRLAVSSTDNAMQASPMSYARYLYTFGGEAAVYCGAMLAMVLWFGSIFKPLCTLIVFLSVFVSIFVNKILLRKPGGYLGYVYTTILISVINFVHAIMLKLSCFIPTFGFPTFICTLLIMITQIIYIAALAMITYISLREWRDMGEEHYKAQMQKIKWQRKGYGAQALQTNVAYHKDNKEYYNDLVRAYRKRQGSPTDDIDKTDYT